MAYRGLFLAFCERDGVFDDLDLPGIISRAVYDQTDGKVPGSAYLYELKSIEVLQAPEWDGFRASIQSRFPSAELRTYIEENTSGGSVSGSHVVTLVSLTPKSGTEDDYAQWYDEEHVPLLRQVPGFLRARRFKLINALNGSSDNTPKVQTHLAVQEYASAEIFKSPEFKAASSTEWRSRVVANTISLDRRTLAFAKQ